MSKTCSKKWVVKGHGEEAASSVTAFTFCFINSSSFNNIIPVFLSKGIMDLKCMDLKLQDVNNATA